MTGFSVTTREPEFDARDRAALIADYADEHAPRSSTGALMSEATDPALEGSWKTRRFEDYSVKKLKRDQELFASEHPGFDLSTFRWSVERR